MSNNIDEILKRASEYIKTHFEYGFKEEDLVPYKLNVIEWNEIKKLQQENNELKQIIDIRECQLEEMEMNKTDYTQVNILEMQLEDYKSRIDKALKIINDEKLSVYKQLDKNPILSRFDDKKNELLQILRGDE